MATYNSGASVADIKDLQTQLNKLGAGLKVDGKYGPLTKKAVHNTVTAAINGKAGEKIAAALVAIGKLPEVKELDKIL